jgi:hypothetical protein
MRKKRRTTRGRLLKGIATLPVALLGNSFFEAAMQKLLKGSPGIYALFKGKKLYYVGLSRDLHGRIRNHLEDRHRGKWDTFQVFKIKRLHYLKDLETLILQIARPPGNRQSGWLPKQQRRALERPFKVALKQMKRDTRLISRAIKFRKA